MSDTDKKLLNCYTDLNRAAISLKLAPEGAGYKVFVAHALKILKSLRNDKGERFGKEIENAVCLGVDFARKADKLLTIGLLLKPNI
jgi:hypothetical protein